VGRAPEKKLASQIAATHELWLIPFCGRSAANTMTLSWTGRAAGREQLRALDERATCCCLAAVARPFEVVGSSFWADKWHLLMMRF